MANILARGLYNKSLQDTICKAEKWTNLTFNKVDWSAHDKAFQSISDKV